MRAIAHRRGHGLAPIGGAICLLLCACQSAERAAPSPWFEPSANRVGADPFNVLRLMADPRAYDILRRHMPKYLAFIEQQVVPAPPADFTLDDFLNVPSAGLTATDIAAIKAELAAQGPPASK